MAGAFFDAKGMFFFLSGVGAFLQVFFKISLFSPPLYLPRPSYLQNPRLSFPLLSLSLSLSLSLDVDGFLSRAAGVLTFSSTNGKGWRTFHHANPKSVALMVSHICVLWRFTRATKTTAGVNTVFPMITEQKQVFDAFKTIGGGHIVFTPFFSDH